MGFYKDFLCIFFPYISNFFFFQVTKFSGVYIYKVCDVLRDTGFKVPHFSFICRKYVALSIDSDFGFIVFSFQLEQKYNVSYVSLGFLIFPHIQM